jgi:hypothetical protein
MTIRKIEKRLGLSRIGTSGLYSKLELESLIVYPEESDIGIRVNKSSAGSHAVVLNLSMNAAVELVKGILLNLQDVTIHADEELQAIIKGAVDRSSADAQAVVDAVVRRREGEK